MIFFFIESTKFSAVRLKEKIAFLNFYYKKYDRWKCCYNGFFLIIKSEKVANRINATAVYEDSSGSCWTFGVKTKPDFGRRYVERPNFGFAHIRSINITGMQANAVLTNTACICSYNIQILTALLLNILRLTSDSAIDYSVWYRDNKIVKLPLMTFS